MSSQNGRILKEKHHNKVTVAFFAPLSVPSHLKRAVVLLAIRDSLGGFCSVPVIWGVHTYGGLVCRIRPARGAYKQLPRWQKGLVNDEKHV
jgi:hypothetical protein